VLDGGRDTGEVRDGGMEPALSVGGAPVVGVGWRLAGRSAVVDVEQVRRRERDLATRKCARGHASGHVFREEAAELRRMEAGGEGAACRTPSPRSGGTRSSPI
jgi:hypothetical protein